MAAYLHTEPEVLEEMARIERRLAHHPADDAWLAFRLSHCRRLLAAMRDGHPERWREYDDPHPTAGSRQMA
jgi:hypothetical protein